MKYRTGGAVRAVALDELTVLYHPGSGATHMVEPLVPALLETLGEMWATPEAVLSRLAASYELPDADASVLAARLDELADAGLVERG